METVTAKEKVCAIVGLNSDVGVFMLDLDRDQDLDGADANGFVDILPNFRVKMCFYFNVLKYTLYLFDNHTNDVAPEVYSIDLLAVSKMSNRRFGKREVRTSFCKRSNCLGPKALLKSLAYRDSILIFSSEINFHYYDDENENKYKFVEYINLKDFELYDPAGKGRVLPQLIVSRPRHSYDNVFKLYDFDNSTYYDEEFTGSQTFDSFSFSIVSFGVDLEEDKFIIETEFGKMFSLKLDGGDNYWRLCEGGYQFVNDSKNIVTSNGICLHAFGANDSRRRRLKQQQKQSTLYEDEYEYEDEDGRSRSCFPSHRCVGFPPTDKEIEKCGLIFRYGRNSSAFDLLKLKGDQSCTQICIVRQAFDYIGADQESSSKLYLWLNVSKVNLQELPDDNDYDKFVKRIRSFKFSVPERIYVPTPFVAGLFYY